MQLDEFREVFEVELRLKPGDTVRVYWTNCGYHYCAKAEVLRLNQRSIAVRLIESVDGYLAGQRITVPNILAMERWSMNNRRQLRKEIVMQKRKGWGRTSLEAVLTPEQRAAGLYLEEQEDKLILFLKGEEVANWPAPWVRAGQPRYATVPEIRATADEILMERGLK